MTSPNIYQALVIRTALLTYHRYGIKVNTHYTPKAMMATAERIIGKKFKARDYEGAANALEAWAKHEKAKQVTLAEIEKRSFYNGKD